jgi:DNA repair protein RecN (Recombination protein N)
MLTNLYIKNYVLIEELNLEPHKGLNIITGETGAGKSIMLGAIGLLMGNRADLRVLSNESEKCIIEGNFRVEDYNLELIFKELDLDYVEPISIRREIAPSGKSRAFVNDTPVTLENLKQISQFLIDIHSQHDTLLLGTQLFQLKVVDAYAGNHEANEAYQLAYKGYQTAKSNYNKLQREHANSQKEFDYNLFLFEELEKANLQPQEQEELEGEIQLLESAEDIKTKLVMVAELLSRSEVAINDQLRQGCQALNSIANLSPTFAGLAERLESTRIELQDLAGEVEREEEGIEYNPQRIEEVQQRLSLIYNLQKKHQLSTIKELLALQASLESKVRMVQNFDEELQSLKKELEQTYNTLLAKGEALAKTRHAVIEPIEKEVKELLFDLGMPNAMLKISPTRLEEPTPEGLELVNFLFSANKGVAPQDISKVASGGEFSRLMLAIKYILAGKTALPTLIFDEIDTGISGEIALKMGKMFQVMAQKHQIISISHLHQIAAKGNHHYFVYKDDSQDRTISKIKRLSDEERITEIAQMISGATPSESAIRSAKELLNY